MEAIEAHTKEAPVQDTPGSQAVAQAPAGISKANLADTVNVKFGLPRLYPGVKFAFPMRLQLSKEAREQQQTFLVKSDEEREREASLHNVRMLADLLVSEPEGFTDFPADPRPLKERVTEYFADERLKTIVTNVMSGYWGAVIPQEYL